ncbi:MAG TPA: hypothetical protein VNS09_24520 [Solirubrobacter sp.]|nr:hypothetical protein [Solirubrobacter sp.]
MISEERRARLGALADQLIPAGSGMPSASQAGVAGRYLDEVLAARPDLEPALDAALASVEGLPAADALTALRADAGGWGVLTAVVPAAYFMNPAIRAAIGYPGLEARPIDPSAPPDYEDLLGSVVERGAVYRPTPD